MKQILSCLLYCSYIHLLFSFPIKENPGFTSWPLGKRDLQPVPASQYSSINGAQLGLEYASVTGTQLGISAKANFGIADPTCRGKMPDPPGTCWTMDQFTVDVSSPTPETCISNTDMYRT